jgi:hypothetical protein
MMKLKVAPIWESNPEQSLRIFPKISLALSAE